MKIIYTLFFSILLLNVFSQAPVMGSINGASVACSSPSSPLTFSTSASNSPTSYSWFVVPSTGVVISNPSNSVTSISFPYSTGTYTIYCSASNGSGTSAFVSYVVTVFETPTVTFSGANAFCQGSSTNLQASSTILAASPTLFYNWMPGTGLNTTFGQNVIANPGTTTIYTVTATKGFCSNTGTISVTPLSLPNVTAFASNISVCFGNPTTLTASGANTYTWSNGVTNGVAFTPSITNTYNVVGTALNGCSNSTLVSVTVNPVPYLNVSSTASVLCVGSSATLQLSSNGTNFYVNSSPTSSNVVISPTVTTNYSITVTNTFSCANSSVFVQNVSSCVGIKEFANTIKDVFKVYPNPNNGSFIIKSDIDETISIINELGQLIKIIQLTGNTDYKISGLQLGVYIIKTHTSAIKIVVTN